VFIVSETKDLDTLLSRLLKIISELGGKPVVIVGTGGGIFKYNTEITKRLGMQLQREDEMECLITGLDFLISKIPGEVFSYDERLSEPFRSSHTCDIKYPYLLVNIGSGVSIVKVFSRTNFERIGGSSIGGGTLWGLLSLLTRAQSFDEMLRLSEKGDNRNVDMLVGDIYGCGYNRIGLKGTAIASSLGKLFRVNDVKSTTTACGEENPLGSGKGFSDEDISRSLLYAVSNNIGQIAYLEARQHNIQNIYFGGSFIGGSHEQTIRTLSYAIRFWSHGEKQAYFLRHEGYLGALGAFLKGMK
ncbi:fumble, partial [Ascobolus immersus RN42]